MPVITTYTRKEYNSTYKTIICINGIPICIAEDANDVTSIIDYLNGQSDVVAVLDRELRCQLNQTRERFKYEKKFKENGIP